MPNLQVENIDVQKLKVHDKNPKQHSKKQIAQIAKSITEFGFVSPILADEQFEIIAGHGRLAAAKTLGFTWVPVIILSHLTAQQKIAYAIADNKLTELGTWNMELLQDEFQLLMAQDLDFDMTVTGFETGDIDIILNPENKTIDTKSDILPELNDADKVCQTGDIWQLGHHRLICGNSLHRCTYNALFGDNKAQLVIADSPYNVKISEIGSMGRIKHDDFQMACGEMSPDEFIQFLMSVMALAKDYSNDGSLHYYWIDWKHIREMTNAGSQVYTELKNICIWNKLTGGMGSLYRSQHEMCCVFKKGLIAHVNNIELGKHGRYRTNVWDFPGANHCAEGRETLKSHPTPKPVQLTKDIILDVTKRGDIVFDPFLGSGTTILAAEQAGRIGYGIEIEPRYCDLTIKRFEKLTGTKATKIGEIK